MYEIKPAILRDILPQGVVDGLVYLIPAHMRDLEAFAANRVMQVVTKIPDPAREDAEAVGTAVFDAVLHQGLHADTDTEQRGTGVDDLTHCLVKAQASDFRHAVTNRAHPGQDDAIRPDDLGRVGANHDATIHGDLFQGLGNGVEVTHAVINDCNSIHSATYIRSVELQATLGRGCDTGHSRVRLQCHTQGTAKGLENSLGNMVGIFAAQAVNMQSDLGVIDKALEKLF